ncbi:hypothetical protein [Pseudomonas citrulli]|uniref:Nucleoid-structuring protein H-NS n=1 Tax=Pseudomonas citrulli TaxID=3064347 RepID=A0ABT9BSV5_9PSED|nr:hypothetical protein [Pseudomonas sp. K18]MDO7895635.1 hypothetical protein [Pseudomonas sp. K18]
MAQRGYPGIHAGMPTTQRRRSASVVDGALKIKNKAKPKQSKAKQKQGGVWGGWLLLVYIIHCGSGLAREGVGTACIKVA